MLLIFLVLPGLYFLCTFCFLFAPVDLLYVRAELELERGDNSFYLRVNGIARARPQQCDSALNCYHTLSKQSLRLRFWASATETMSSDPSTAWGSLLGSPASSLTITLAGSLGCILCQLDKSICQLKEKKKSVNVFYRDINTHCPSLRAQVWPVIAKF